MDVAINWLVVVARHCSLIKGGEIYKKLDNKFTNNVKLLER